jgi:rhomboid protease GluP
MGLGAPVREDQTLRVVKSGRVRHSGSAVFHPGVRLLLNAFSLLFMLSPDPDPLLNGEHERPVEDLAEAGTYDSASAGFERGLVVLAMGIPYWLIAAGGNFRLLVEATYLDAVRAQLASYERESVSWPPQYARALPPARRPVILAPMVWGLLVLSVFRAQTEWPGWLEDHGAMDAQAVFGHGELWRAATALFLHADAAHVISNLGGGLFIFSALLTTMGRLRGTVLLGLASIFGNLLVAALSFPAPYHSLGASTAIFAALGLLTGGAIRALLQKGVFLRWREVFVPLATGITVLALFGAGGVNVDLGAHASGFTVGLVLGGLLGRGRDISSTSRD